VDIQTVELAPEGDRAANARRFFQQVGDPYVFRVDEVTVHVQFAGTDGGTLQGHIQNLLAAAIGPGA
jgi:hypothetical protein